jgi:exoribonuclease R
MLNWIGGTLELASKVRYGLTSRGVPLFRFIPYDKRFSPMAVGCSTRDLFYNIHAIVEPQQTPTKPNELPKGVIIQTDVTEKDVLLATYALDSKKALRKEFTMDGFSHKPDFTTRLFVKEGFTFHIDPPGCLDADDSFTFEKKDKGWKVWIHIADVAAWIPEGCPLDLNAQQRATTFYSSDGAALVPMLPRVLSEQMASLSQPGPRATVSLCFDWIPGQDPTNFAWHETVSECQARFTYEELNQGRVLAFGEELNQGRVLAFGEEAFEDIRTIPEMEALRHLARQLGGDINDSHTWVQMLMLLYNKKAGTLLKEHNAGVLRRHGPPQTKKLEPLREFLLKDVGLMFLAFESAEYCLPTDSNTAHFGLETNAYAYASSPLRRYVDLVNQRCLKNILQSKSNSPLTAEFVVEMNRRGKQAKAFNRDLFFSSALLDQKAKAMEANITPISYGTVLSITNAKGKYDVYVPEWKRIIKVKTLDYFPEPGTKVQLSWYEDRTQARWKERMVFKAQEENGNSGSPPSAHP